MAVQFQRRLARPGFAPFEGQFFGAGDRKVGSLLSQAIAPVPEPQTYALMLGGLGLMGFMARGGSKQRKQP